MNKPCDFEKKRPKCGKCQLRGVEIDYILIPSSMGSSAEGQPFAPENGAHRNAVVKYEADGHVYIYTSEGIPVQLSDGGSGGGGDVISVNGKTGVVVLTTSDIRNTSDYQTGDEVLVSIENALSQLVIPTRTSELVNDSDFQTGTEVADAISAAVPTNVSELTNDANYQNAQQVATAVAGEATLRQNADNNLQSQIDAISASSDVTDIVGTYAELQAYDTSTLGDNDIIKVLQDESRNGETTYYRWSTATQTFTLIGEEGPYYTKSEADGRFVAQTTYTTDKAALEAAIATKQNTLTAGANVNITGDVISATDTTYSDFTGTDGTTAGTAGLVPAPATTDAGKFLKADGTWDTVSAGPTIVQTTGSSTTDVMSQNATTRMVHDGSNSWASIYVPPESGKNYLASRSSIHILPSRTNLGQSSVVLGGNDGGASDVVAVGIGSSAGYEGVAVGRNATAAQYGTVVGMSAEVTGRYSVAIGNHSLSSRNLEVSVGNPNYATAPTRFLANVTDPVLPQDAATKNYTDGLVVSYASLNGAGAPTTATEAKYVGQLYYDTTGADMYYCSAITPQGTTPETYTYTWVQLGGGSSVNVVQTIGTSTTDVMSQDAVTNELYDAAGNIRLGSSATASSADGPNIIIGKGDSVLAGNYGKIIIGDNITDTNIQPNTIEIGSGAYSASGGNIAIGYFANSGSGSEAVAFGPNSSCRGESRATAIGARAAAGRGGVALGAYSRTTRNGEVNIGSTNTSWGYNSTNYRVLGGVHPAVDAHDAVTLGQMSARILAGGTAAPTTFTVGEVGTLYAYVESGTGHLAICTAADASTSTYTWQTLI